MSDIKMATSRKIDSVWTLVYTATESSIFIYKLNRTEQLGYDLEKELPTYEVVESDSRTVTQVIIEGKTYDVINQKYIFHYN